ncbi:MAG: helix-turn-helix domain-containing protein [Candidatus Aminicenantes bacterium]|nr:helix-turn-helix domain-containing protein [Candidatus Aminicenantes bacterium]
MASLGQNLRRERELRGISVEEISDSTRINSKLLKALEEDRLNEMPGEFFIKAILRSYAKCVGLEENTVLNWYYEASLLQEQFNKSQLQEKKTQQPLPKKIKRLIGMMIIIFIFLIVFVFIHFSGGEKESSLPQEELQASALTKEDNPASLPEVVSIDKTAFEIHNLTLEISFLEETWLQVYSDGKLMVEDIKGPGERITVEASKEFLIHLGNAGGVSYKLNDREGKPLGSSGTTVRGIRITTENYTEFLVQRQGTIPNP